MDSAPLPSPPRALLWPWSARAPSSSYTPRAVRRRRWCCLAAAAMLVALVGILNRLDGDGEDIRRVGEGPGAHVEWAENPAPPSVKSTRVTSTRLDLHLAPLSRICTVCRDVLRTTPDGVYMTLRGVEWQQLRLRAAAVAVRAAGGPSTFPERVMTTPWAQQDAFRSAPTLGAHGLLLSPAFLFDSRFSVKVSARLVCEAARLSLQHMADVSAAREEEASGGAPLAEPALRNALDGVQGYYGLPVSGGATAGWAQMMAPRTFVERTAAAHAPGIATLSFQEVPNSMPSHFWRAALSGRQGLLARVAPQHDAADTVSTKAWLPVRKATRRLQELLDQLASSSIDVTLPDVSRVRLPASPSPSFASTPPAWDGGGRVEGPGVGKEASDEEAGGIEEGAHEDEAHNGNGEAVFRRQLDAGNISLPDGGRLLGAIRYPTASGALMALAASRTSTMAMKLNIRGAERAAGCFLAAFDTVVTRCGFLLTPPPPPRAGRIPTAADHRRPVGFNITYHPHVMYLDHCLSGYEAGLPPADGGAWAASLPQHDEVIVLSYYLEEQIYHWTADSLAALGPTLSYLRSHPHVKLHVLNPDLASRARFRREHLTLLFGSDSWQQRLVSGDIRARIAHIPDRHGITSPHIIWLLLLRERLRSAFGLTDARIRAYPQFAPGALRDLSQLDAPRPPPTRFFLPRTVVASGGRALAPVVAAPLRPVRQPFTIVYARRDDSRVLSVDGELLCRLRALQAWSRRSSRRRPVSVVDVWERALPSEVEQLRIFSAANLVIGAHGAGLTHMLATPAGACLVEVLPSTFASAVYMRQSAAMGFRYVPLVGEGCKTCPLVEVDIGAVLGAVASCLPAELLSAGAAYALTHESRCDPARMRVPSPTPAPPPNANTSPATSHETSGVSGPKYLHVLSCPEGMSGWLQSLKEAVLVATVLGRVLVLPCVRAGILVPCTPGKVLPVPLENEATVAALAADPEADSRAFPAFRHDCPRRGGELIPEDDDHVFPLEAYFSAAGIRDLLTDALAGRTEESAAARVAVGLPPLARDAPRPRPQYVSFEEWATRQLYAPTDSIALNATSPLLSSMVRWHASIDGTVEVPAAGVIFSGPCDGSRTTSSSLPFQRGAFRFVSGTQCLSKRRSSLPPQIRSHPGRGLLLDFLPLAAPPWRDTTDVFALSWYRGLGGDAGPLPTLHPAHLAAAHSWITSLPGGSFAGSSAGAASGAASVPVYAALQWRTETLGIGSRWSFDKCAPHVTPVLAATTAQLATAAAARLTKGVGSHGSGVPPPLVLITDIPASANPCTPSRYYNDHTFTSHLATLLGAASPGAIVKYDAALAAAGRWPLDAGVLALREYALGAGANFYQTCNDRRESVGPLCSHCSWYSEFVLRTVQAREAGGRRSSESMLDSDAAPGVQHAALSVGALYAAPPRPGAGMSAHSELEEEGDDGLVCFTPPCGPPRPRLDLSPASLCPRRPQCATPVGGNKKSQPPVGGAQPCAGGLVLTYAPHGMHVGAQAQRLAELHVLARATGLGYLHTGVESAQDLPLEGAGSTQVRGGADSGLLDSVDKADDGETALARLQAALRLPEFRTLGCARQPPDPATSAAVVTVPVAGSSEPGVRDAAGCVHLVRHDETLVWQELRALAAGACAANMRLVLHVRGVWRVLDAHPMLRSAPGTSLRPHLPWLHEASCVGVVPESSSSSPETSCPRVRVAIHARATTASSSGHWPPMATFVAIAAHVSRALHALRVPHAFQVFVDWRGREDADSVRAQFTALGISAPFTVASASDAQTTRALQALASAHVLVMGPSSLSYAAGLLHEPGVGLVLYTPQFHSAREDWHELPRFDEAGRGAPRGWDEELRSFVASRRRALPFSFS